MPPATQVRDIRIRVDAGQSSEALKKISNNMARMTKASQTTSTAISKMSWVMQAFIGYLGIKEIMNMSDSMQQLGDRLRLITGNSLEAANTLGLLVDTANRTKTSLDSTGKIYTRIALSVKDIGLAQRDVVDLTEVLNNSFRLSGASAEEAAGSSIQLAQALGKGRLDGDELKSILEQNVVVGGLLAKQFGVTRGELKKLGETGKLSATGVLKALFNGMGEVNEQAKTLSTTFGQSLTLAMNTLTVKLGELNKAFGLAEKFAAIVGTLADNIGLLTAALGGLAIAIAALKIPAMVAAFAGPQAAAVLFAAAVVALASAIYYLIDSMGGLKAFTDQTVQGFRDFVSFVDSGFSKAMTLMISLFTDLKTGSYDLATSAAVAGGAVVKLRKDLSNSDPLFYLRENIEKTTNSVGDLTTIADDAGGVFSLFKRMDQATSDREALLNDAEKKRLARERAQEEAANPLLRLNRLYLAGAVDAKEYYKSLDDAKIEKIAMGFKKGTKDLAAFQNEINESKQVDLIRNFNDGTLSVDQFNESMHKLGMEKLNRDLETGATTFQKYTKSVMDLNEAFQFSPVSQGLQRYADSVKDVNAQLSSVVTTTFTKMEDEMLEFLKTGKRDFADFAQSILDELSKIAIRMYILKPLADALGTFATPAAATASVPTGPAIGGGTYAVPFASGGIVNSPTYFGNQGKLGLMGEAGPEAIIPLSRTSDGSLGVSGIQNPVNVTVINQAGVDVSTSESRGPGGERQIDILIVGKIKEAIAKGSLDKTFQSTYGLSRRGT